MIYLCDIPYNRTATFICRPNRFLAEVELDCGASALAHVHDPGRLRELLIPGVPLLLKTADSATRKTAYDVIAVRSEEQWVLINSAYHRRIAEALLANPDICPFGRLSSCRAEVKHGKSRFDFYINDARGTSSWIEVKGCSLVEGTIALFPDAPTERGARHLEHLTEISYTEPAAVFILVLKKAGLFMPHAERDPHFAKVFEKASKHIQIFIFQLCYQDGKVYFEGMLPYRV